MALSSKRSAQRAALTFDDVREIALSMPEVEETTAYGMPAFKAGKTRFVGRPVERSGVEPNTLGVRVSVEERDGLIASRPDIYYLTEHYAAHPAVLVRLSNIRRNQLRELLGTAWRFAMERRPAKKKR
jgi:hypothetical protein